MTTPDLSFLIPTKWKAWVGLIGSALSFAVPFVLEVSESLPAPWPAGIGVLLFLLTALGVYKAPYLPPEAVMAPKAQVPVVDQPTPADPPDQGRNDGGYDNPYRQ